MYHKIFWVYIMGSVSGTLYIGITNNLYRRVLQHRTKSNEGFTRKYGCTRLLYYEEFSYVLNAIQREKQLKKWNRKKKEILINSMNPEWIDLFYD